MGVTPTADDAIAAALTHDWKEAIHINTRILQGDTNNIAALNRLGYAYAQSGQMTKAKLTSQKVLRLDPYNQIAVKQSKKLASVKKKLLPRSPLARISPLSFLEEPGKTKIVSAVNLAPAQILSLLSPGDELTLKPKNHCVEVRIDVNTYVAALPDDVSFKLLKLMASGNRYQAIIKSVEKKSLILLLREIARGKRFADHPSFTPSSINVSALGHIPIDHEGGKPPNISPTGETDTEETEAKDEHEMSSEETP
ncbi:hypothetical protein HY411_00880 [Candidatus Gottesmanbacteria bacterium]|nr:hypothetical protein [Candidatus Gottesmanbacteria bacterium]